MKDKNSNKSKGVGFCKFYSADDAAKAMEDKDNLNLGGRNIGISYSNEKKDTQQTNTFKKDTNYNGPVYSIFVGNLSFKATEATIEKMFKSCGQVKDVRIAKKDGKSRGFAHVDFDSEEAVEKAMKLSGTKLDGREVRVDRAQQGPKKTGGNKGGFNKGGFKKGVDNMTKAMKSGAIISAGSSEKPKVQKFEESDDDDEE